jgi:hypothetical protein
MGQPSLYCRTASFAMCKTRRHGPLGLMLVASLVALGVLVTRVAAIGGAPHRVYTVAAVRALVDRAPGRWLGQELTLRATAEPCPWWGDAERARHCASQPLELVQAGSTRPSASLPVTRAAPSSLEAFASRLPALGDLVPRPATLPLYRVARFRVRLQSLPASACAGHLPCYEALWLSAPDL